MKHRNERGLATMVVILLIMILMIILFASMNHIESLAKELKITEKNHNKQYNE